MAGNRILEQLMSQSPKSRLCSRPHSHAPVIFFIVFWHSYFLRYGHFVEYMNIQCSELMQLTVVVGLLDVAPMASQLWGVSAGQARHNSINVGVSLRQGGTQL